MIEDPSLSGAGAIALGLTGAAIVLFVWNRFRADVVALIIMAALMVSGVITPNQGLRGFGHEATITVALMLVLAAGLVRTGAVAALARLMTGWARGGETRLLLITLLIVLPLSALINNTAAVAVLLPVLLGLGRTTNIPASRLLMPLSFTSQMGGMLTLIGTSTNLLVAGIALDLGVERIRLFDLTAPAAIVAAVGLLYLLTVGRWLLPHRRAETDLLRGYELHDYLTVLRVPEGSPLANRSLAESRLGSEYRLQALFLDRDGTRLAPSGATILRTGDVLLVAGKATEIARIVEDQSHLELADRSLAQELTDEEPSGTRLAEVLVPARSAAAHATVRELALRARFGISAIAVRRHGTSMHDTLAEIPLEPGDILLVRGTAAQLQRLHEESGLTLIGAVEVPQVRRERMWLAVAIMAGVVAAPALGLTRIVVSALVGAVLMLVTRCITPDEAYAEIDWMVIVLLAAILPLGEALHATGAAAWIAGGMLTYVEPLGPYGLLASLLLFTTALTAVVSNAAAGAVLTPIAIVMSSSLGFAPLPFVLGVMFGASTSFITPVGYQTNTMIYGPGGYRFIDYLRVGGPLSLLVAAAATFAIPLFFPFE